MFLRRVCYGWVKHTRTLNNTCAFANHYERAQEISQVYFQYFFFECSSRLLVHSAEKYPDSLNIVVRLLMFKGRHIRPVIQKINRSILKCRWHLPLIRTNNIAKNKIVLEKNKINKLENILHQIYYEPNTHLTIRYQEIEAKILSGVFDLKERKKKKKHWKARKRRKSTWNWKRKTFIKQKNLSN